MFGSYPARVTTLLSACLLAGDCIGQESFFSDFESGLQGWQPNAAQNAMLVPEAGKDNQVLQLTPNTGELSHVIFADTPDSGHLAMQGRLLFPTTGDGYLGFIYNHAPRRDRSDYGVIYLKSNGSYLRISPHYDGNPSWRLHEEQRVDLAGVDAIRPGVWYPFRLEVHGRAAAVWIGTPEQPRVIFLEAPPGPGKLGLEARPGFGEPVWVDDIRIGTIAARSLGEPPAPPPARLDDWKFLPAIADPQDAAMVPPDLADAAWQPLARDSRGAVLTGPLTQIHSGDAHVVYLRADFAAETEVAAAWFAASSANRIDVWLDGQSYLGTVAPRPFIWSDHLTNPEHPGARLPLQYSAGTHWLLLRVFGKRFAAGGFFADLTEG